jgi:hypothetical protein
MSRNGGENVGTYTIRQGNLTLNSNYAIKFSGSDLTITSRPVTITVDAKIKVYGDPDPELTWRIDSSSLIGTYTFSGELTRDSGENASTYTIRLGTLSLNNNYAITCSEAHLTITARPLAVTADSKIKVYGDTDPALTWRITSGT